MWCRVVEIVVVERYYSNAAYLKFRLSCYVIGLSDIYEIAAVQIFRALNLEVTFETVGLIG